MVIYVLLIRLLHPRPQVWYGVRAKVHEHRLAQAQRQARQVKGNRKNRYVVVIKVMKINREGDGFP